MRAKLALFVLCPGRQRRVAPLTVVWQERCTAQTKRRRCSLRSERQLQRKGGESSKISAAPPSSVFVCPPLSTLLRLPPPRASQSTQQPFVPRPDQTAQLFIATKNRGFPQQIVNKQSRLLRCGGGCGEGESLARRLDGFASSNCYALPSCAGLSKSHLKSRDSPRLQVPGEESRNRASVRSVGWGGENPSSKPGEESGNRPYFGNERSMIFDVPAWWRELGHARTPSQLLPVILRPFEAHFQVAEAQRLE